MSFLQRGFDLYFWSSPIANPFVTFCAAVVVTWIAPKVSADYVVACDADEVFTTSALVFLNVMITYVLIIVFVENFFFLLCSVAFFNQLGVSSGFVGWAFFGAHW